MSEPTFSSSSTRSRTQSVCDDVRKTTVHTQSHDGAISMQVTQKYTDPKRGHWNHGYESMHFADMNVARELATAINQSADWVESGKPVPTMEYIAASQLRQHIGVPESKPEPEDDREWLWSILVILWTMLAMGAGVILERMFL